MNGLQINSTISLSHSHFTTDGRSVGQSVSQSVLALSPLQGSWPDFGCCQDRCCFVCNVWVLPVKKMGLSC